MDEIIEEFGTWIDLRLSDDESLTLERTKEMLGDTKYIISEEGGEGGTRYHQHIVWVIQKEIKEVREIVREFYPEIKGNKCLYIKEARDKKKSASYTVKEGKFVSNKFSPEYIKRVLKTSCKKEDMKKKFGRLDDKFILDEIDQYEYLSQRMILKAQHDQNIYINHERAYFNKMMVRKDPKKAYQLVSQILGEN